MERCEEGIEESTQSSSSSKCSHPLFPSDDIDFCAKCGKATHTPEERNTNIQRSQPRVLPPQSSGSREEDVLVVVAWCYKSGCDKMATINCQADGCSNKGCQRHLRVVRQFGTGRIIQYCNKCASKNTCYYWLFLLSLVFGIILLFSAIVVPYAVPN